MTTMHDILCYGISIPSISLISRKIRHRKPNSEQTYVTCIEHRVSNTYKSVYSTNVTHIHIFIDASCLTEWVYLVICDVWPAIIVLDPIEPILANCSQNYHRQVTQYLTAGECYNNVMIMLLLNIYIQR